jgi:hypothetical protein
MSTNFGIPKQELPIELGDENGIFDYINEDFFNNVAHRSNSGKIYWSSSLGKYLSDKTRVYALDNSQQGINTIGDIKREIETQ